MKEVTAKANANIALIKYWGKRDDSLFLPTKSSISFTLPHLTTTTTIAISDAPQDTIKINEKLVQDEKITRFLNLFRKKYCVSDTFVINSKNSFPTAAGLASSSSGFAALAKGLCKLYDLAMAGRTPEAPTKELSILARRGSGSACRSVYDGFVIWHRGVTPPTGGTTQKTHSYAEQLFPPEHWPEFHIVIALADESSKKVSSRIGMQKTIETSPHYEKWVKRSESRIPHMIDAIKHKDIDAVGTLAERDCLEMHHCIQTSTPSINYLRPKTRQITDVVKKLRLEQKIPCYFTIDAGPNVKIITLKEHAQTVVEELKEICSVLTF